MPSLYGFTGNANVAVGNTIGLYQQNTGVTQVLTSAQTLLSLLSNASTVGFSLTSANTQVQGTVLPSGVTGGTYGNVDYFPIITVGNDGRVTNVVLESIAAATGGYGNANVAAFLPHYGGVIDSTQIQDNAQVNIASQNYVQLQYDPTGTYDPTGLQNGSWTYLDAGGLTYQSNVSGAVRTITFDNLADISADGNITTLGRFVTTAGVYWANGQPYSSGGGGTIYGNANVAAYLAAGTDPTIIGINANVAGANAAQIAANTIQSNQINAINANVGSFYTYANATYSTQANAGSLQNQITGANAAIVTANTAMKAYVDAANTIQSNQIQTLSANLGAFEAYANATFGTSNYGNANVAAYLPTYTGNVGAGNVVTTGGTILNAGLTTSGNITTTGNVNSNQLHTTDGIYAQGNITAPYYLGDGSQLTNIVTKLVAGANIALSPAGGQGQVTISTIGGTAPNTSTGYYGSFYDTTNQYANVATNSYTIGINSTVGTNGVSLVNGNAMSFSNSGVYNVNFSIQFVNTDNAQHEANVWLVQNGTPLSYTNSQVTIPARANPLTPGASLMTVPFVITVVAGDTVQLAWQQDSGSSAVYIASLTSGTSPTRPAIPGVVLNATQVTSVTGNQYGNSNVATFLSAGFGSNTITTTGNITAGNLISTGYVQGDGSKLTNLPVQPGTYSNTNVAAYLTTATINTTGNITGGNIAGTKGTFTNIAGTLLTAAQPNITSVGTLTSLAVTGNVTAGNLISNGFVQGDGSKLTNLPIQPGTYSNANVASYLPTYSGNIGNLTVIGNITMPTQIAQFSSNSSWTAPAGVTAVNVLIVDGGSGGGGGDSGGSYGGGGGAGGRVSYITQIPVTTGTNYSIVVGAGGAGGAAGAAGSNGQSSSAFGYYGSAQVYPPNGAASDYVYGGVQGGTNSPNSGLGGQATNTVGTSTGGIGGGPIRYANGGGGGGYSAAGSPGISGGGAGGAGITYNVSGTAVTYSVGGGGSNGISTGTFSTTPGSGGGGGAATGAGTAGQNGIVIITYIYGGTITAGNVISTNGFYWANGAPYAGTYSNTNVASYLPTYSGNVNAAYFTGNGAFLTGITSLYSNANVTALLNSGVSGNIVANTGGYFLGNGAFLTGVTANYSNANVASYLPVYAGNVDGVLTNNTNNGYQPYIRGIGSLASATTIYSSSGNIQVGGVGFAELSVTASQITSTQPIVVNSGNVSVNGGWVVASANIKTSDRFFTTNGFYWANGAPYAGTYSNVDVGNYLTNYSGNIASLQFGPGQQILEYGNIQIVGAGQNFGQLLAYGNVSAGIGANGGFFIGDGSKLSNLPTFNGNLNSQVLFSGNTTGPLVSNTYPFSTPTGATSGAYTNFGTLPTLTYTGGVLQQQPAIVGQVSGFARSANIGLQSFYNSASNRTTIDNLFYNQWWPVTANIMTNNDRVRGVFAATEIMLNGKTWGTMNYASATALTINAVGASAYATGAGEISALIGTSGTVNIVPKNGSANVQYATGVLGAINYNAGVGNAYTASNVAMARLFAGTLTATGNLTFQNGAALHVANGWVTGGTVTNRFAVLNEDATSLIQTNSNINVIGNGLINHNTFTVTALNAITGVSGQMAAVSNGTGKNGGQMAYWDTTNNRWSWVDTNTAVI